MPINIAAPGSSATASSTLPIRVRVSRNCKSSVRMMATIPATSCATGTNIPPMSMVPDKAFPGSDTKFAEKNQNAV